MVRTTAQLINASKGPEPHQVALQLIAETSRFLRSLDQHAGQTAAEYSLKGPIDGTVMAELQHHYAPHGWQVTGQGNGLNFRFFSRGELTTLSADLEAYIDAQLDGVTFRHGGRATIALPNVEPLVLQVTLAKYMQADPYMNIRLNTVPGRRGIEAIFEHDAGRLAQDYYAK